MNNKKTGVTEALKARQPPGMPKQDQSAQPHMHKCTCHGKWFMMSNWHVLQVSRFFHFANLNLKVNSISPRLIADKKLQGSV